ncbi:hypothetical protein [Aquimarina sp. 2201CG14-23]|uniref:hypothetical protein n=1 Tax=Aquimarina mycalae TaxID=3040073 RepID=UPI002477D12D|nr:hypothetical protein [Aquimarina sp. 2201CG14-23]MDH7447064.1 hypothetical protein [Aquimarina sp. 2201CG14-23]
MRKAKRILVIICIVCYGIGNSQEGNIQREVEPMNLSNWDQKSSLTDREKALNEYISLFTMLHEVKEVTKVARSKGIKLEGLKKELLSENSSFSKSADLGNKIKATLNRFNGRSFAKSGSLSKKDAISAFLPLVMDSSLDVLAKSVATAPLSQKASITYDEAIRTLEFSASEECRDTYSICQLGAIQETLSLVSVQFSAAGAFFLIREAYTAGALTPINLVTLGISVSAALIADVIGLVKGYRECSLAYRVCERDASIEPTH